MDELLRDLRFGVRCLLASPLFAAGSVAVLALGISLAATLFAVIQGALLEPWPYRGADRLVTIRGSFPAQGRTAFPFWSAREVADLASASDVFQDVIAGDARNANLTYEGRPERVRAAVVTPNVFRMLGVGAELGRVAEAADAAPGAAPVTVVSDAFWRTRLGADPTVIGRVLRLEGAPYEVVGVMPASFRFWDRELWIPLRLDPGEARTNRRWVAQGELRPGVSIAAARARLSLLANRLAGEHPEVPEYEGLTIGLNFLLLDVLRGLAPTLYLLLAAVVLVLLVTAANLANAMLTRGLAREGELAVRRALGGSTGQLVRQLAVESGLIGVAGGLAGAAGAAFLLPAMLSLIPYGYIPAEARVVVDWRVVAAATACGLLCSALFGVLPAVRVARVDPGVLLKRADSRTASGRTHRWRDRLVAAQIALAVLVTGVASVAALTLRGTVGRSPGFAPRGVFTARVALPAASDARGRAERYDQLLRRIRQTAGVRSAAVASAMPIAPLPSVLVSAEPGGAVSSSATDADLLAISPGLLDVLSVPTIAGRDFSDGDGPDAPRVAILGAGLARRLWPGGGAVGRRLWIGSAGSFSPATVVGVSGDVQTDVARADVRPMLFLPMAQRPPIVGVFAVRSSDPEHVAGAVERAVAAVDRDLPVFGQETLEASRLDALGPQLLAVVLLGAFGLSVLVLSAAGIYAVVSQSARERTRELAIRRAFGADSRTLFRAELVRAGRVIAAGGALGAAGAVVTLRLLGASFTVFHAAIPGSVAASVVAVAALALVGAAVPAWRAATRDPISGLVPR